MCGIFEVGSSERHANTSRPHSFATGWNYFLKYAIVLPNNLTVTGIIIAYWRPDLNVSIWIVVFGAIIIGLNVSNPYSP